MVVLPIFCLHVCNSFQYSLHFKSIIYDLYERKTLHMIFILCLGTVGCQVASCLLAVPRIVKDSVTVRNSAPRSDAAPQGVTCRRRQRLRRCANAADRWSPRSSDRWPGRLILGQRHEAGEGSHGLLRNMSCVCVGSRPSEKLEVLMMCFVLTKKQHCCWYMRKHTVSAQGLMNMDQL